MFIDAGVNLYLGHGFTTSSFARLPAASFYAMNPFYPGLVFLWLKCFGFSFFSVRALPVVLANGSLALVAAACLRAGLIREPVRLPEGALQCHWHLELTPQGVEAARRLPH
jgi:hypothetical protein